MAACLSFHQHHVLRQSCSGTRRNQNLEFLDEKVTYVFRLFDFKYFFCLFFSPFLFFLLQWLTFYWACLQLKKTSKKASSRWAIFTMEKPCVVTGDLLRVFHALNFGHFCATCIFINAWSIPSFLLRYISVFGMAIEKWPDYNLGPAWVSIKIHKYVASSWV